MKRTLLILASAAALSAQGLDPAVLLKPPPGAWPTYNGDYTGRRFSALNQVNASNVGSLTLAWIFRTHNLNVKSTPVLSGGALYFTAPENVWAVDARTGRQIWHFRYHAEGGDQIGNRGLGMYHDLLFFTTPDAHLLALNAKDGSVRWDTVLADVKLGYFATVAPLVIRNHVIVGVSGDVTDIPGFLQSVDPETGKTQWRWYTAPKKGEPGSETWPKDTDAIEHGGGMTWITGSYDPELNLLYWGTGNPNPVLAGEGRPGDNLFTCSIVALNPDSGKLVWYFQPSPHDVHDWDAVQTPVLFDADFHGVRRKLLAQASRNGYFFVLDRSNGKNLVTAPFVETNWASGVDSIGRPIARQDKYPTPDGTLVEPASDGATNWMAPSFDPDTGLFYVSARRIFSIFYHTASGKPEGWGGRDRNLWGNSVLQAIDYRTGKIRWSHELGDGEDIAGILTTAGGLLFTADNSGNLLALDPATGKTLWHTGVGARMESSPMTYQLDGKQYVLTAVQDLVLVWKLAGD